MTLLQHAYLLLPSSIALLLIVLGSNFKDKEKPILRKIMKRSFVVISICFFIVWTMGSFGYLLDYIPYSDKLSSNYFFSGIMLNGYIAAISKRNEPL